MKIAISSTGPNLTDRVDPRFGRAAGFVIVDLDTDGVKYVDNSRAQMQGHGAGIQAAETIARAGARVLLTGSVGPKAFQALGAAGIKVVEQMDGLTVAEAIAQFKKLQAEKGLARGARL